MQAGGSTGIPPISATPAAGKTPAPKADTTATNNLERVLRTIDSSSDCCQGEEKAKGSETCAKSLERGTLLLRGRHGELHPHRAVFDGRRAFGLTRRDARDHADVRIRAADHDGQAPIELTAGIRRERPFGEVAPWLSSRDAEHAECHRARRALR